MAVTAVAICGCTSKLQSAKPGDTLTTDSSSQATGQGEGNNTGTVNGTGGTTQVRKTCGAGEVLYGNNCYAKTKSCTIGNGAGQQTFGASSYGNCVVTACDNGYFPNYTTNVCYPVNRSCYVPHGSGLEYWEGSAGWSGCLVLSCSSGYTLDAANVCHAPQDSSITTSVKEVIPGSNIQVSYNGGSQAYKCVVSLSNGTVTDYNPWGLLEPYGVLAADSITATTTFKLHCIDRSGAYTAATDALTTVKVVPVDVKNKSIQEYFARLGIYRNGLWQRPVGDWEVWYDGAGTPDDGVTNPYYWDNPIDDDWNEPRVVSQSFSFNNPSPGYLLVDRISNSLDWNKGGVISRRDEFLHSSYGITIEFRAKIFPDSGIYADLGSSVVRDHNAFSLTYTREDGVASVLMVSPRQLQAGGYLLGDANIGLPKVAFDSTDFNTYRFVQYPGQNHFYIYLNNSTTPILEGDGTAAYPVNSVTDHEHPTVIIGGEGAFRTHFILDYVRYRRGAFAPGESMPPPITRLAPPMPDPLPVFGQENFVVGFDSTHYFTDPYGIFPSLNSQVIHGQTFLFGCNAGWTKAADDSMEYKPSAAPTCMIPKIPGIYGTGDVTIEARIKVMPDSTTRGFSIFYSDELGTHGIVFSPNKVETVQGIKNIGYQALNIDATSDYHTYRLVRRSGQFYSHLYVDDNPVPQIIDQRGDASTGLSVLPTDGFLEFGYAFNPNPNAGHVLVKYIRWAPTAYAPALR